MVGFVGADGPDGTIPHNRQALKAVKEGHSSFAVFRHVALNLVGVPADTTDVSSRHIWAIGGHMPVENHAGLLPNTLTLAVSDC